MKKVLFPATKKKAEKKVEKKAAKNPRVAMKPKSLGRQKLKNVAVLHKYLEKFKGNTWRNATTMAKTERVIVALFTHNSSVLHDMAFELALAVPSKKLAEITGRYSSRARQGIMDAIVAENNRFLKIAQLDAELSAPASPPVPGVPKVAKAPQVPDVPKASKASPVPDDLTDDAVTKDLKASFQSSFTLPSNKTPAPNASTASPATDKLATPANKKSRVGKFVYSVDAKFSAAPHWAKSKRGSSGFKYVSLDESKNKPWRVKVGSRSVANYYTKSEACQAAYLFVRDNVVWDSPYEKFLGGKFDDLNYDK